MQESRDAIGCVVHQPVLNGDGTVTKHLRLTGLLHTELREMADTIRNQLPTLRRVQLALLVEEFIHIHTPQLGDALFLRHLGIKLVNLLFEIDVRMTACKQCRDTDNK